MLIDAFSPDDIRLTEYRECLHALPEDVLDHLRGHDARIAACADIVKPLLLYRTHLVAIRCNRLQQRERTTHAPIVSNIRAKSDRCGEKTAQTLTGAFNEWSEATDCCGGFTFLPSTFREIVKMRQ